MRRQSDPGRFFRTALIGLVMVVAILGLAGRLAVLNEPGRSVGVVFQELFSLNSGSAADTEVDAETLQLRRENTALREQLGIPKSSDKDTIGAEVVGSNVHDLRKIVTINRGEVDGVSQSAPVFVRNYLVGVVEKVRANSSDVLLVTDPLFRTTVAIGSEKAEGLLIGEISGAYVSRVPTTSDVEAGDVILTSGLDDFTQSGWVVGTVASVNHREDEVFFSLIVELPINIDHIQFVQVGQ